jgi:hypothetical protein
VSDSWIPVAPASLVTAADRVTMGSDDGRPEGAAKPAARAAPVIAAAVMF